MGRGSPFGEVKSDARPPAEGAGVPVVDGHHNAWFGPVQDGDFVLTSFPAFFMMLRQAASRKDLRPRNKKPTCIDGFQAEEKWTTKR